MKFLSCGMWRHVVWQIITDALAEPASSVFRVGGRGFLQNIDNSVPDYTVLRPRQQYCS
jgi:hypothetical protein